MSGKESPDIVYDEGTINSSEKPTAEHIAGNEASMEKGGKHKSVALNIVENPLQVGAHNFIILHIYIKT